MRTVSGDQIADAIALNGYPVGKRHFFKSHPEVPDDTSIKSDEELAELPPGDLVDACALAQGALNLGVGMYSLLNAMQQADSVRTLLIFPMNDKSNKTPKQIAAYVRKSFKGVEFTVSEFDYGAVFANYQGKKV